MLTEMVEYGHKIEEEVKLKKNTQGTNSEGKETGTQINGLEQKEKRKFNQNGMKKQQFRKMRRGLGTSGTTLNVPTSKSQGCQ